MMKFKIVIAVAVFLSLAACGSGGDNIQPPGPEIEGTFQIQGLVSGEDTYGNGSGALMVCSFNDDGSVYIHGNEVEPGEPTNEDTVRRLITIRDNSQAYQSNSIGEIAGGPGTEDPSVELLKDEEHFELSEDEVCFIEYNKDDDSFQVTGSIRCPKISNVDNQDEFIQLSGEFKCDSRFKTIDGKTSRFH